MINKKTLSTATLPTVLGIALTIGLPVLGHEGRNFEVQIVDDQLRLQGVNTLTESAPENEPGISPQGRTYFGAVHDHFEYITLDETTVRGIAEQPGFLVSQSLTQLAGEQLTLTVVGAVKWEVDRDSTIDPITGQLLEGFDINTIDFVDLDADETISVLSTRVEDQSATTDGGSFLLAQNILGDNANLDEVDGFDDIEVFYEIGVERPDSIFVIESVLQTSAEGVADSESFFTILSPDGQGFAQVLHFPSLQAEQFFGTPVPEPGSITLVALLPVLMRRRRRG